MDGMIRAGMVIELPREGVAPMRMGIAAVEIVSGPRPPEIGLCLRFGTEEELATLQALSLEGATLQVV
jgi:hypothetical protein